MASESPRHKNEEIRVRKRNGQIVAFHADRIQNAIANAFKQDAGIPRESELPPTALDDVNRVTQAVVHTINAAAATHGKTIFSVEEIQDEVIRQLMEHGFQQVGLLYSEYRKEHAQRRSLFERYTTIKRDGRHVSFKPEKITMAIAKALRAHHQGQMTPELYQLAEDLSRQVVALIQEKWPQGAAVPIETIQDLVERTLMDNGLHAVARRYILYREQRAKLRQRGPLSEDTDWSRYEKYHIVKEDGTRVLLDLHELKFTLSTCTQGLESVDTELILKEALKNYYDGITEKQAEAANIMAAKSFLEKDPQYTYAAARLLLLKCYKEALGREVGFEEMKTEYRTYFKEYIRRGVEWEHLSPDLLDFDLDYLAQRLEPQRDFLFRYMGLQILYDRYFIHHEGRRIELPQIFWMRVAMGVAKKEDPLQKNQRAAAFYDMMSRFRYCPSTPTLFNSGTPHSQLSSCFLTTVEDDLWHIFKCIQDDAMLSKWSGGLGNDWTNVRAMGARIKGTNGRSQGVIPFLKVANDTAVAVNQGGKRQGAMCAYLEVWHLDIEEFLELRKNTGDERRRTHDMHTANWIPDLFMKRVKANADWTLFSPNEVPDLHHLYGRAFEKRYEEYERMAEEGKLQQYKIVPAVHLWRKMLNMLFETGHPWLTWKDPSNIRSPQDHVGVIHSSNLCTEILLNTSKEETAVCNLGSINLAAHTTPDGLDEDKLAETIRVAMRMLDNVIDVNFYPTKEAETANRRHRPVGLGIMGFQDALWIQGLHYASPEAAEFADESMEIISYHAILASTELAAEKGPYATFKGSKWDRGLLPYDTIALLEQERGGYLTMDRSRRKDWTPVREAIRRHGMRNSNCMAIAPTATIANIIGVTSSIEPLYKNIFVKSNLSGEFTVVNEFLVQDLKSLGLWDDEMIDDLKYFDGSIQEIERIPEELKQKYATAFEIDYEWLIEAASRRQKWIDMGQSLNLYQAKPSGPKVSAMYMLAWEKGLKTTYYLRSMGATRIEKSTLDITKEKYVGNILGRRQRDEKGHVVDLKLKPTAAATSVSHAKSASSGLSIEPTEDCEACQ